MSVLFMWADGAQRKASIGIIREEKTYPVAVVAVVVAVDEGLLVVFSASFSLFGFDFRLRISLQFAFSRHGATLLSVAAKRKITGEDK